VLVTADVLLLCLLSFRLSKACSTKTPNSSNNKSQ